jgi:dolichol-phosphate mannosyltransferase
VKKNISILTPMANEEQTAEKFIMEILSFKKYFNNFRYFVVIDKSSTDSTYKIVKKLEKKFKSLTVIWSPKNKTVVDAYIEGYKNCLKTDCDWILEIDAGGSHKAKNLFNFIKFMNFDYDCIYGSRFCKGGEMINSNFIRYLCSKGGSLLTKLLFKLNIKDTTSGYQIFTKKTLKKIVKKKLLSKDRFFQTEIKIYTRKLKIKEVPIQYICKTHTMSLYAIFESIYLLVIIKFFKKNYLNS